MLLLPISSSAAEAIETVREDGGLPDGLATASATNLLSESERLLWLEIVWETAARDIASLLATYAPNSALMVSCKTRKDSACSCVIFC